MRPRTLLHLPLEGLDTLGGDAPEKVNVVVAVEGGHLLGTRGMLLVALHLAEQAVVEDKVVGQLDAEGLHGVATPIVVVPYVLLVVVRCAGACEHTTEGGEGGLDLEAARTRAGTHRPEGWGWVGQGSHREEASARTGRGCLAVEQPHGGGKGCE